MTDVTGFRTYKRHREVLKEPWRSSKKIFFKNKFLDKLNRMLFNKTFYSRIMQNKIRLFLKNKYVDLFLIILIIFNVVCLGFETDKSIYSTYKSFFEQIELISVIIFTIEYILRVISLKSFKSLFHPLMIIDFLAILPFYLPFLDVDLRVLRMFRLVKALRVLRTLRILRIFKLARYFDALQLIGKVMFKKRHELVSILGLLLFSIFISSFFMFYAESEAQPKVFTNILDTFWWSMVTFTTVGYGDMVPITPLGKFISAVVVLIGIMLFALPTSILTAEFLNEFQKTDIEKKEQNIQN